MCVSEDFDEEGNEKGSSIEECMHRLSMNEVALKTNSLSSLGLMLQRRHLTQVVEEWAYGTQGKMCCILPEDSKLRQQCMWIVALPAFQPVVDIMTLFCTVVLAINCPLWFPSHGAGWWAFWVLDVIFASFFTVELVVRVLAQGSVVLSTAWGKLDLIVVIASWLALLEGMSVSSFVAGSCSSLCCRIARFQRWPGVAYSAGAPVSTAN